MEKKSSDNTRYKKIKHLVPGDIVVNPDGSRSVVSIYPAAMGIPGRIRNDIVPVLIPPTAPSPK